LAPKELEREGLRIHTGATHPGDGSDGDERKGGRVVTKMVAAIKRQGTWFGSSCGFVQWLEGGGCNSVTDLRVIEELCVYRAGKDTGG